MQECSLVHPHLLAVVAMMGSWYNKEAMISVPWHGYSVKERQLNNHWSQRSGKCAEIYCSGLLKDELLLAITRLIVPGGDVNYITNAIGSSRDYIKLNATSSGLSEERQAVQQPCRWSTRAIHLMRVDGSILSKTSWPCPNQPQADLPASHQCYALTTVS